MLPVSFFMICESVCFFWPCFWPFNINVLFFKQNIKLIHCLSKKNCKQIYEIKIAISKRKSIRTAAKQRNIDRLIETILFQIIVRKLFAKQPWNNKRNNNTTNLFSGGSNIVRNRASFEETKGTEKIVKKKSSHKLKLSLYHCSAWGTFSVGERRRSN